MAFDPNNYVAPTADPNVFETVVNGKTVYTGSQSGAEGAYNNATNPSGGSSPPSSGGGSYEGGHLIPNGGATNPADQLAGLDAAAGGHWDGDRNSPSAIAAAYAAAPGTGTAPGTSGTGNFDYVNLQTEQLTQTAINDAAQMAAINKELDLVKIPMAQVQKDQLIEQAARDAVTALIGQQFGAQAAVQAAAALQSQEAQFAISTSASLRGPRNAFQQQEVMHGLNADGLSNSVDAIAGKVGGSVFSAPHAAPQAATLDTLAEDLHAAGGNNGTLSPGDQAMLAAEGLSDPSNPVYQLINSEASAGGAASIDPWSTDTSTNAAPVGSYNTINGPKTLDQMESELRTAGWDGNYNDPTAVANAYADTSKGPVTAGTGASTPSITPPTTTFIPPVILPTTPPSSNPPLSTTPPSMNHPLPPPASIPHAYVAPVVPPPAPITAPTGAAPLNTMTPNTASASTPSTASAFGAATNEMNKQYSPAPQPSSDPTKAQPSGGPSSVTYTHPDGHSIQINTGGLGWKPPPSGGVLGSGPPNNGPSGAMGNVGLPPVHVEPLPSGVAPPAYQQATYTAPGSDTYNDYLNSLVDPNKIDVREWNKLSPDDQQFYLSGYEAKGYSGNDILNTVGRISAPFANSPSYGSYAPSS